MMLKSVSANFQALARSFQNSLCPSFCLSVSLPNEIFKRDFQTKYPNKISKQNRVLKVCYWKFCLKLCLNFHNSSGTATHFFRRAHEAQNTINSSLRSKNSWISIFYCMRHIYVLVETHKKIDPFSAKIAVFRSKVPFWGPF